MWSHFFHSTRVPLWFTAAVPSEKPAGHQKCIRKCSTLNSCELWTFGVGNTSMKPCISLVREGEHTAPMQDSYHCTKDILENQQGGASTSATFETLTMKLWSLCLSPIFQHAETAYSQHKPSLETSGGYFASFLCPSLTKTEKKSQCI